MEPPGLCIWPPKSQKTETEGSQRKSASPPPSLLWRQTLCGSVSTSSVFIRAAPVPLQAVFRHRGCSQALNKQVSIFTGRLDLVQRPRPPEDLTLILLDISHTSLMPHLVLFLSGLNGFCFFLVTSFCLCEVSASFRTHSNFEWPKPQKGNI